MKYLFILLLLAGCSSQSSDKPAEPIEPTSILIGDSRCAGNYLIEDRDCEPGRKLTSIDYIDPTPDIIVLHLGINDMSQGVDPEVFKAHLQYLITDIEDKVWCILPTWHNEHIPVHIIQAYRQAFIDTCQTIDPQIQPYQDDGIHYTEENYRQVSEVYGSITATR